MIVELTYSYSKLDKVHQFGIEFKDENPYMQNYIRWVFYYLGAFYGENRPSIYPFSLNNVKPFKKYKFCNDSKRQARLVVNAINKKLNK